MAKPSQTFKKRQRENKLREKAQMKRDRRQQRRSERVALRENNGLQDGAPDGLSPLEPVTEASGVEVQD